jgi:hypothetical protein
MVALVVAAVLGFVTVSGHVDLAPDNGFYSMLEGDVVKLDGSEEVAVIGQGKSGHLLLGRPLDDRFKRIGSIQKTVVAMEMKMNEFTHGLLLRVIPIQWYWAVWN